MHTNSTRDSMKEKITAAGEVMDGSGIMKLVENDKVFTTFVDHKFQELDTDCDGKLSVQDLQPAVKDIGASLGLPAHGASPQSDHIYTEVLHEFAHGKQDEIDKAEFKSVLSDFLTGMAAGLKRDPVVILRIDGEDLQEFVTGPKFEAEMISIFSEIKELCHDGSSLKDYLIKAFEKLTVDHGTPPATDPWIIKNVLEPALVTIDCSSSQITEESFLGEFRKAAQNVVQLLKEQPAIIAHSWSIFDGSRLRKLISNKFELNKKLDHAINIVPRDVDNNISKEYLSAAFDSLAVAIGLPVHQIDSITVEVLKKFDVGDGKSVTEDEFKKILTEVVNSVTQQLEGNPLSVSVNSVVHEQPSQPSASP